MLLTAQVLPKLFSENEEKKAFLLSESEEKAMLQEAGRLVWWALPVLFVVVRP